MITAAELEEQIHRIRKDRAESSALAFEKEHSDILNSIIDGIKGRAHLSGPRKVLVDTTKMVARMRYCRAYGHLIDLDKFTSDLRGTLHHRGYAIREVTKGIPTIFNVASDWVQLYVRES